jgi:O-antigen ligase
MMLMRERFAIPRVSHRMPISLIEVVAATYGVGVVALFTSGRVDLFLAGVLLGGPVVLALALLRPEWTILIMVALPPSLIFPIPTLLLIVIMLTALFGCVLQGGLRLGPETGVYPLIGIIALAIAMKADVPAAATAVAGEMLKSIIYYTLIMLVAFHAARNSRIEIDSFLNALLLGIVVSAILQPFFAADTNFYAIDSTPFRGKFAYLAAMGFGVTYVRYSLSRAGKRRRYALDPILALAFFGLTAIGFGRAAWIATLWVFALVSKWIGSKSFWFASAILLAIVLTVPVVSERIVSETPGDVTSSVTLSQLTSGRSDLWTDLWNRGVDALPMGQGWGYMWSLTPMDIFGVETFVTSVAFVYPHNDFLFLFVELGIIGFGLLAAFWLNLFQKVRRLSRSQREPIRYRVRILVPVLIVMFVVQMFDNGFAISFVADKFFAAAGLVLGMYHATRESGRVGSQMIRPTLQSQGRDQQVPRRYVGER